MNEQAIEKTRHDIRAMLIEEQLVAPHEFDCYVLVNHKTGIEECDSRIDLKGYERKSALRRSDDPDEIVRIRITEKVVDFIRKTVDEENPSLRCIISVNGGCSVSITK